MFVAAPSLTPEGVVITAIDSRTLLISWLPPPFDHRNGIIRVYTVNITERETGMICHLATAATSLTIPSLHPFYTYDCTLTAFTIAEGPYSVKVNITMPEDGMSSSVSIPLTYPVTIYVHYTYYSSQQCSKDAQNYHCVLHLCCANMGSPPP